MAFHGPGPWNGLKILVSAVQSRAEARWLRRRGHGAAPPDLLVYHRRRMRPVFFAEAKLEADRMRANQWRHFARLYRRLRLPTRVYPLKIR